MSILVSTVPGAVLEDRQWVRKTFMLAADGIDKNDMLVQAMNGDNPATGRINTQFASARLRSAARRKFTNTRLGGNWTINNVPQFTRHADPRETGLDARNKRSGYYGFHTITDTQDLGMGPYYSEAIDDNSQRIYLQFGLPVYNGMLSFFTGFYDNDVALLATEGLGTIAYYTGFAAGLVVGIAAWPLVLIGEAVNFFLNRPTARYYYMRETMPLYWTRVQTIANSIAVNMGLVPRIYQDHFTDKTDPDLTSIQNKEDAMPGYRAAFHAAESDIFEENGGINVYALATRPQRMADLRYIAIENAIKEAGGDPKQLVKKLAEMDAESIILQPEAGAPTTWEGYLKEYHNLQLNQPTARSAMQGTLQSQDVTALGTAAPANTAPAQAAANATAAQADQPAAQDQASAQAELPPNATPTQKAAASAETAAGGNERGFYAKWAPGDNQGDPQKTNEGWLDKLMGNGDGRDTFFGHYMAARRDGGKFLQLRVDHTGSISESFSNSFGKPSIASKINGRSSDARNARFDLSDGNTGVGIIDAATGALKNMMEGALDAIHLSGLMSLAGAAFVDIPDRWEDASTSFPTASYNIELRTPYGHRYARYTNLMVPLACILAGALPHSAGKAAYTQPFLCSLFSRGRQQIRLGMIDSLSITRGAGNFGWNNKGEVLAIDVSFTVKDLSSIMHAPIDSGFSLLTPWKNMLFDNENPFNDYMAVLGNLSLADQYYPIRRMMLNLTKKFANANSYFTAAHFASMMDESWVTKWVGTTISAVTRASEGTNL